MVEDANTGHDERRAGGERAKAARDLLRGADVATLATSNGTEPHAALVTPVYLSDLSPVLLLSELSRHTAQLRINPCCALLTIGPSPGGATSLNPQTRPRLSLSCVAQPDAEPTTRECYLARRPYASLYAGLGDFQFWRLRIISAQFIEGFARAWSLSATELAPHPGLAAQLEGGARGAISRLNIVHAGTIERLGRVAGGVEARWRVIGVDIDGCDLMADGRWARLAWAQPLAELTDVELGLAAALEEASTS
jgi:putative heme iron utilization protein